MGGTRLVLLLDTRVPRRQRLARRGPGKRLLHECQSWGGRAPERARPLSAGCPQNRFGMSCEHTCSCRNGGLCHAADGSCSCGLGWTGPRCELGE